MTLKGWRVVKPQHNQKKKNLEDFYQDCSEYSPGAKNGPTPKKTYIGKKGGGRVVRRCHVSYVTRASS